MDINTFLLGMIAILALGIFILLIFVVAKDTSSPDGGEKLRQEIYDGLNKAISQLEKTV